MAKRAIYFTFVSSLNPHTHSLYPAEQAAFPRDHDEFDFFAKASAHHRSQIANAINEPELDSLGAGPKLAGKKCLVLFRQAVMRQILLLLR